MNIFLSRNNQSFGPYSEEELLSQLRGGAVLQTDLAWWEGAATWVPVATLPFVPKSTLPPPMAEYGPYGVQAVPNATRRFSKFAIFSLIFSIVSIIPLAGFTSFLGIIFGHIAVSRCSKKTLRGKTLAWIAVGLGYFGLLLCIYFLVTLVPFIYHEAEKQAAEATTVQSPVADSPTEAETAERTEKIQDLSKRAQKIWQLAAHAALDSVTTGDAAIGWPANVGAKSSNEFYENLRRNGYVTVEDLEKMFPVGFWVANVSEADPGETLFLASRNVSPSFEIEDIEPFGPYAIVMNKAGEVRVFHASEQQAMMQFIKLPDRWPRTLP
jgi:hypothetical protein